MRALLAAALALLAAACASTPGGLEPLGVHVVDVEPISGGGRFEQLLRVELRLQNPNDVPVRLDGMRFALAVNDRPLARGTSTEPVVVPRLGEQLVAVDVSTTVLDLARQLAALDAGARFDYAIDGTLFVREPHDAPMRIEHEGRLASED